jgi:hypothetical protein
VVQKEKRRREGGCWMAGESSPEPRRTQKEKRGKKPTARYLVDQYGEKGKAIKKKKKVI